MPKDIFIDLATFLSLSLSLFVSVSIARLQSDTDKGDAFRSRDTAELMDLSQTSK